MSHVPSELEVWYQQASDILIGKFPLGMAHSLSAVSRVTAVYSPGLSQVANAIACRDGTIILVFPAFLQGAQRYYQRLREEGRGSGVSPETAFLAFVLAEEILHIVMLHYPRGDALQSIGYPLVLIQSAAHIELGVMMKAMGFVLAENMALPTDVGLPPDCVAMEDIVKALAEKFRGEEEPLMELNQKWQEAVGQGEQVAVKVAGGVSIPPTGGDEEKQGEEEGQEGESVRDLARQLGLPLPDMISLSDEGVSPYPVGIVDARRSLGKFLGERPGLLPLGERIFSSPPPQNLLRGLADVLSGIARRGQEKWVRRVDPRLSMVVGTPMMSIRPMGGDIGVVVDTSGSMLMRLGGKRLVDDAISIALGASGLNWNAWIVPCDAQGYIPFRPHDYRGVVYGGGGTELWRGIETLFDRQKYPQLPAHYDIIVVITDGYSIWPDAAELKEFRQQHQTRMFMVLLGCEDTLHLPEHITTFFEVLPCLVL